MPTIDLKSSLAEVSSLESYGMRPHLMTGMLVQLFRAHFASSSTIEEPTLRETLWRADARGGMIVESAARWNPKAAGQAPAVIVKRNRWNVVRRGIGDQLEYYGGGDISGDAYYTTFLQGSHTLFCVAHEANQAERVAAEVYRELIEFGPVIREKLCLDRFVLAGVEEPMKLKETPEALAVPVVVTYTFEESWRLSQEVPVLGGISIEAVLGDSA